MQKSHKSKSTRSSLSIEIPPRKSIEVNKQRERERERAKSLLPTELKQLFKDFV